MNQRVDLAQSSSRIAQIQAIVIAHNMLFLLLLYAMATQIQADCQPEIQLVSPSGVVRASLNQPLTFTCEAQASAVTWFVNYQHVSEGNNLALKLEESSTVTLDSVECIRQRNLTGIASSLANNISVTCSPFGISMPPPQILFLVEGTESVIIHSNNAGYQPTMALSSLNGSITNLKEMKNNVSLTWDQPFTSDDPNSFRYKVKITHLGTNTIVQQIELSKTELVIPAEELQHCCNYSVSVGAKTENFTANVSHTIIQCSGFPPTINTHTISINLSWTKEMAADVTFTIDGIPNFECPRQRPENVTIITQSLPTGNIVTTTFAIYSLSQTLQSSLMGLEKHQKFRSIFLLSNQFGYSTFNDTISFTTFAVQGLVSTIEGNRVMLTCTFMEGSLACGCHIELTLATSGKKDAVSIYKNMNSSTTVYVQQNGPYNVSVYDIDAEEVVVHPVAFSTIIWVESSNTQSVSPTTTTYPHLSNSATLLQPSTEITPNSTQSGPWLFVAIGVGAMVLLVVCGIIMLTLCNYAHRHKRPKPSVANTTFYCTDNNYEFHQPAKA